MRGPRLWTAMVLVCLQTHAGSIPTRASAQDVQTPADGQVQTPSLLRTGEDPRSVEIRQIDARAAEIRAEYGEYGLRAPIAVMASGFGVFAVFGVAALFDVLFDPFLEGIDGEAEPAPERSKRSQRVLGGISLAGLAVGIGGSAFLGTRLQHRRPLGRELRALQLRRGQLVPSIAPTSDGLRMHWRF